MKKYIVSVISILVLLSGCIQVFAAEPRVVRVGAFNYYPGIFKDNDGVVKGFYVDALSDIAQRENIRFEYVYGSWSEGLERIKTGEVDVITSVAFSEERSKFLDYATTPLLTVWGELYAPLSSEIDGIREVHGKKVAVMKGDYNARHFIELAKKFDISCEFVEMPGFDDVFKAVASKKVDVGVVNSTFGVAKQREYGLRSTGVVFNPFDIFFAVAKGKNQDLLALLENYLANWRHQADSPYNKARQKWSHGSAGTLPVIPGWLVNAVIALGLLVAAGMVFIVLLRRQVRGATADILQSKVFLQESERKYRQLFQSMQNGFALHEVICDEQGVPCDYRFLEINPAFERLTGLRAEDIVGRRVLEVIPETDRSWIETCGKVVMSGESVLFEHYSERVKRYFAVMSYSPQPGQFATVISDISERKTAEKELQDKNTELERFTYTVSHDLKSPLITIQSYAGMIRKDMEAGDHARARDDLKRIEGAACRMTCLLDDLLELSRVGRMIGPSSEVDMNLLVSDTLRQLAGLVKDSQVEIAVHPDLPSVHGNQQQISEVVQNLIENAIKYMGEQSAPRVEIGVRQDGNEEVFFVRDNGIGIEPRFHEGIFGLFNKLDANSEGTGVGLALVKRIIEVHGGRVWVESAGGGRGSCFYFQLPGA